MFIPWMEKFSVNVKEIDEQHKKFVGIINSTYDEVSSGMKNKGKISEILKQLSDYAKEHFSTEEKYFDMYHYEKADEHKEKHREMLDKLAELQNRYEKEGDEVVMDFLYFLESWLVEHLEMQDHEYVECFNKNGLH